MWENNTIKWKTQLRGKFFNGYWNNPHICGTDKGRTSPHEILSRRPINGRIEEARSARHCGENGN